MDSESRHEVQTHGDDQRWSPPPAPGVKSVGVSGTHRPRPPTTGRFIAQAATELAPAPTATHDASSAFSQHS